MKASFLQVYDGNSNRNGIIINDLEVPIEALVIRINPVEWYGHISMRMELYGCRLPSGNSSAVSLRFCKYVAYVQQTRTDCVSPYCQ